MKTKNSEKFSQISNGRGFFIIGLLILLTLVTFSCSADVTPSFTAMNQANMSLNVTEGNIALGDYLYLTDTTEVSSDDEILVKYWNYTANNTTSQNFKDVNNPVFGPFNNNGSVIVNLTAINATGEKFSTFNVYQVIDGSKWIEADFSDDAKYDNRTSEHPFGTITLTDNSIVKLDPEAKIIDWWWRYTNNTGVIIGNYSEVNSIILPMNSWVDSYLVNLTVKNNQGNLVSISKVMVVPPNDVHPDSGFVVTQFSGPAPLNISVIDQSRSMVNYSLTDVPLYYEYTIGNQTSSNVFDQVFTTQNLNLTLQYPGVYDITQKVTNAYGVSNQTKFQGIVVSNGHNPQAMFTSNPGTGTYPLNVSFIDQSKGSLPLSYTWDFGDNTQVVYDNPNPVHKFTLPGSYNVTLIVTNSIGSSKAFNYIEVTEPSDNALNFSWVQDYGRSPYSVTLLPLGITPDWNVSWTAEKGIITKSTDFSPNVVFPSKGSYNVTLDANRDGLVLKQVERVVEVFPENKPTPVITVTGLNAADSTFYKPYVWPNQEINFFSNISSSWEDSWFWDFGDNSTSPLRSPVHSYSSPGIYDVSLKASNINGESAFAEKATVYVLYPVNLSIDASPLFINAPGTVQFTPIISVNGKSSEESVNYVSKFFWNFGDQSVSLETAPSHVYQLDPDVIYPHNYTTKLQVSLINGQIKSNETDINVSVANSSCIVPNFNYEVIDRNGTYCYSYKFQDASKSYCNSSVSRNWDFGDGTPGSTIINPTHLYKEPGNFTVSLTVSDGLNNVASTTKVVNVSYGV